MTRIVTSDLGGEGGNFHCYHLKLGKFVAKCYKFPSIFPCCMDMDRSKAIVDTLYGIYVVHFTLEEVYSKTVMVEQHVAYSSASSSAVSYSAETCTGQSSKGSTVTGK